MSEESASVFNWIDYSVLGVMLILSVMVGVYFGCYGSKVKSMAEYLTGNRKMATIPIAVSLIASQLTGVLIISVPGEIYVYGVQYSLIVVSMLLAVVVINKLILPVFYENNIINCYEYLELRFDKKLRTLQTTQFVVTVLLLLPVTLYLPAVVFAEVTKCNVHLINAILSAVCVFYTTLGGVRAVVWTDVVQAGIVILSSLVVVTIGIRNVGSFWYVIHLAIEGNRFEIFDTTFDLSTRHTIWNILSGYTIMAISYTALNPSSMNRIMSLPSLKQAQRALSLFGIGNFVIVLLNCLTGLVIYAKYYQCDPIKANLVQKPDELVPYFIKQIVGHIPGLTGLFVSCVFAAGLSTMSANLNSLSGVLYEDWIKTWINTHAEPKANVITKSLVIVIGFYCVSMGLVLESFSSILQLVLLVLSVTNGSTLGVYFLGLMWPRANRFGTLWASVISTLSVAALVVYCQLNVASGKVRIPKLDTSIEKCDVIDAVNGTITMPTPTQIQEDPETIGDSFNVAIPWCAVLGFSLTCLLGIIISRCTRNKEPLKYKSTLVASCCRKYVPKEILDVEMTVLDEPENKTLLAN